MTVYASTDRLLPVPDALDPTRIAKIEGALSPGQRVNLVDGTTATYDHLYRSQPWVRAVIDKLSHGIGRLPAKPYRASDDERHRERVKRGTHRGADLLYRPYPGGTPFLFWSRIVHEVAKEGLGYGLLLRDDPSAVPDTVVPAASRTVRPVVHTHASGERELVAYEATISGVRHVLDPYDVIPFGFVSRISPLTSLARTLALEDAGQRAAIASFANGIRPSGIVSLDPGVIGQRDGKMTKPQLEYLRDELQAEHGGVDRRFKLAAVNAAIRWTPLAHTAQEAEMIEHRRLNREEVCGVYDIPPPVVHILDRATYSNIDEQHRMLYMDTMGPWLTMLEQTWNAFVHEHPLLSPVLGGVYLEFDLDGVLRGDLAARAEAYQKLIRTGFSLNDLRALENMPRIEHPLADAVFAPRDLLPIGPGIDADVEAISLAAQRLALAGKNGAVETDEIRELLNRLGADLDTARQLSPSDGPAVVVPAAD